jgi:hypothetical protein
MIGIVLVITLVILYLGVTVFNERTEIPEECRDLK